MRTVSSTILAVALGVLLATPAAAHSVQEQIQAVLADFAAAFNNGDAAGVAAHYTEDAALLPPGGQRVDGRADVQAFWQGAIDGGVEDLTLRAVEVEASGRTAYEVGRFSFKSPGGNGEPVPVSGKYVVVWKKDGDAWRLHRDIWNTDPAPAAE